MPITKIVQLPGAQRPKQPKKRNAMPDGRRRVRITVTDADGRQRQKAFYGPTIKAAEEARDKWLADRDASTQPAPVKTVGEWAEIWLDTYGRRAGHSTSAINAINVRKITDAIGAVPLTDVREVDIQRIANGIKHTSKSQVAKMRGTLNAVFRAAIGNRLVDGNPCDGVRWDYGAAGTHRYLQPWEIQHIAASWREHRAGIWAMIMMYAGLRRGELIALRWSDIDMDAGVLHIRAGVHFEGNRGVRGATKTEASVRDVPLFGPLVEALEGLCGPVRSPYVCCAASGAAITEAAWRRAWDGYQTAMECLLNGEAAYQPGRRADKDPDTRKRFNVRPHDLRHTFASMLYDAGVDIKTAQKLLGHATPEMTMRVYTHLSDAKMQTGIDKMREYLKN